jgi:LacI family transcriptional regulator
MGLPNRPRITLSDVAAHAGVSIPTVSKVLNNRADIGEPTRRRVEGAIADTGYRRRASAKRVGRAGLVDVVVNGVNSPWVLEVIAGAEQAAYHAGVGLVVTATHGDGDGLRENWLKNLGRRRSDGVVLVVSDIPEETLDRLTATNVPVVLVDRTGNSDPRLPSIGAANWSGALSATQHLLDQGHRRIGMIGGHPRLACSAERVDGYHAALRRAGISVDPDLVLHGDFFPEGGMIAAAQLLSLREPPTAIFAGSDLQALGVYEEARRRGLRIPDDLSVVGFDDLSIAQYVSPPLTTVRQPHSEMAAQAVRKVLSMQRTDRPSSPIRIELATSLVVRASTKRYAKT